MEHQKAKAIPKLIGKEYGITQEIGYHVHR